ATITRRIAPPPPGSAASRSGRAATRKGLTVRGKTTASASWLARPVLSGAIEKNQGARDRSCRRRNKPGQRAGGAEINRAAWRDADHAHAFNAILEQTLGRQDARRIPGIELDAEDVPPLVGRDEQVVAKCRKRATAIKRDRGSTSGSWQCIRR